jgi:ATP-dependent RNA helicase DeaD
MQLSEASEILPKALIDAIAHRGIETLTAVQAAVLRSAPADRDLRVSSQTGSGKTLAIGFMVRELVSGEIAPKQPRVLVITPSRELAKQVQDELKWLFSGMGVNIASATGGGGYAYELRAFSQGAHVVVATPGRLLDHLKRGSLSAGDVQAVVLDEADRMLDMGFREDLEAIFSYAPKERRTHLVSATFTRDVLRLADRVQDKPVRLEGTPLGQANADIEHIVHVVAPGEIVASLINLLLVEPDEKTLVFLRTRAEVAELSGDLSDAGFRVSTLSGEMEQRERTRALADFKSGRTRILIATDVAARGIDVTDISRVIQVEPPSDADNYVHRSGRTGRAGKKGQSIILIPRPALNRVRYLLKNARVNADIKPVPGREQILALQIERLVADLAKSKNDAPVPFMQGAQALLEARGVTLTHDAVDDDTEDQGEAVKELIGELLATLHQRGFANPRALTRVDSGGTDRGADRGRGSDFGGREGGRDFGGRGGGRGGRDFGGRGGGDFGSRGGPSLRETPNDPNFATFEVSWGEAHGADPRRMMAMLCRRGGIEGRDIGAMEIGRATSIVQVATHSARTFAKKTEAPDPRDPKIRIRPFGAIPPASAAARPHASSWSSEGPSAKARKSTRQLPNEGESVRDLEAPAKVSRKSTRQLPNEGESVRDLEAPAKVSRKSTRQLPNEGESVRDLEAPAKVSRKSTRQLPNEGESAREVGAAEERPARPKKGVGDSAPRTFDSDARPERSYRNDERGEDRGAKGHAGKDRPAERPARGSWSDRGAPSRERPGSARDRGGPRGTSDGSRPGGYRGDDSRRGPPPAGRGGAGGAGGYGKPRGDSRGSPPSRGGGPSRGPTAGGGVGKYGKPSPLVGRGGAPERRGPSRGDERPKRPKIRDVDRKPRK